jgi:hypothetical protein
MNIWKFILVILGYLTFGLIKAKADELPPTPKTSHCLPKDHPYYFPTRDEWLEQQSKGKN